MASFRKTAANKSATTKKTDCPKAIGQAQKILLAQEESFAKMIEQLIGLKDACHIWKFCDGDSQATVRVFYRHLSWRGGADLFPCKKKSLC